jgi:hypothetical protein
MDGRGPAPFGGGYVPGGGMYCGAREESVSQTTVVVGGGEKTHVASVALATRRTLLFHRLIITMSDEKTLLTLCVWRHARGVGHWLHEW